jgi:hypothetical protein
MLFETQFAEDAESVGRQDFLRRTVGIERDGDRHQTANQMGIAVAAIMQKDASVGGVARFALKPDLTDAAAHLIDVVMGGLVERLERASQFDDIAIAILPLVEEGEIGANGVDRMQRRARVQGRKGSRL